MISKLQAFACAFIIGGLSLQAQYSTPAHKSSVGTILDFKKHTKTPRRQQLGADYMTRHWEYIKKIPLNMFLMGGSHHFTFDKGTGPCAPQGATVAEQIKGGVRYGDVRLTAVKSSGSFYFEADHGSLCVAESTHFKDDIKGMKSLLGTNDLFIFHLKNIYNFSDFDKSELHRDLNKVFETTFGADMITPNELAKAGLTMATASLEELRKLGRIIVISPQVGGTTAAPNGSSILYSNKGDRTMGGTQYNNISDEISYPYKSFQKIGVGGENVRVLNFLTEYLRKTNAISVNSLGFSEKDAFLSGNTFSLRKDGEAWNHSVSREEKNGRPGISMLQDMLLKTDKGFAFNVDGVEYGAKSSRDVFAILLDGVLQRCKPPTLIESVKTPNGYRLELAWGKTWIRQKPIEIWGYDIAGKIWKKVSDVTAYSNDGGSSFLTEVPKAGYYYIVNKLSGYRSPVYNVGNQRIVFDHGKAELPYHFNFENSLENTGAVKGAKLKLTIPGGGGLTYKKGAKSTYAAIKGSSFFNLMSASGKGTVFDFYGNTTFSVWFNKSGHYSFDLSSGYYEDGSTLAMHIPTRFAQIQTRINRVVQTNLWNAMHANAWYHLAIVKKGTLLTFYINGKALGTSNVLQKVKGDGYWRISKLLENEWTDVLHMDELKIYNKALTAAELTSEYEQGNPETVNRTTVARPTLKATLASKFQVYPNPASSFVSIANPGVASSVLNTLTVSDYAGRVILTKSFHFSAGQPYSLALKKMLPGHYTLKVTSNQKVYTGKIIIKK